MSDNVADMNSGFYLTVLRDMETVANRVLRVLKPLVVTTASLCDQGDEASPLTHVKPARHNHSTLRANTLALSGANHLGSVACSDYLTPVHPQLRLLHRDLNRQLEQATLTAHLIQGLQESFVQRGRDRANDTLYLLTVVTTIVTPLQIFAGVCQETHAHTASARTLRRHTRAVLTTCATCVVSRFVCRRHELRQLSGAAL